MRAGLVLNNIRVGRCPWGSHTARLYRTRHLHWHLVQLKKKLQITSIVYIYIRITFLKLLLEITPGLRWCCCLGGGREGQGRALHTSLLFLTCSFGSLRHLLKVGTFCWYLLLIAISIAVVCDNPTRKKKGERDHKVSLEFGERLGRSSRGTTTTIPIKE